MIETGAIILNVDDREAARYTKSRHLKKFGYEVVEAADGAEALRKVEEVRPAVVLLDVRLPDMSGIEVCEIIKAKWPEVMVLQTSATYVKTEDRIRGLNGGADSYLIQPTEPEELAAAIGALLRIRRAEDAMRNLNELLENRVRERTAVLETLNEELKSQIAQREMAEAALVQAQKMEAIGRLTGGLAHDFNNLLTAIVGNLDLILVGSKDARTLRLAGNAFKAAERGSKLTAQLLAFSRTQKLAARPVAVNDLIIGMSDMLAQALGPSIQVATVLDPEAGMARTDDNQLEVAILNLAINARDAMQDAGTLTISTRRRELLVPDGDLLPGKYITVSVVDTGEGMTPDVIGKAFDPFFTTKAAGKGTGLGLAQVYGISRQCGGTARILSQAGRGTNVTIWLRCSEAAEPLTDDAVAAPISVNGSGEILLIDDDPDVRDTLQELLAELGYTVHAAENADAGLRLLERTNPDIVILDFAMPDVNGAEAAKAIRVKRQALPILFVSGYADTVALGEAVGDAPILHKPFSRAEFAAAVHAARRKVVQQRPD